MEDDSPSAQWLSVFEHRQQSPVADAAFVLLALGIEHEVTPSPEGWHLWVPLTEADRATTELARYWRENRHVASRVRPRRAVESGLIGALCYLITLCAIPWLQDGSATPYRSLGALAVDALREGEWWRTVTALTLHADLAHLASNALFGVFFGTLLARQLGSGIAWLAVLGAGTMGNLINALLREPGFVSIGASTAVFGAIGALGAVSWLAGYYRNTDWRRAVAPLFAGFTLFAFTGTAGLQTDVLAHFTGLLSGFALGCALALAPASIIARPWQFACALVAALLLLGCWGLALAPTPP
ncbi:MAG: rhomboid family intramembrane serine protease [Pseudomonadota bacterium]